MTGDNDPGPEPTLFCATLTPHRSLGPNGFVVLMAAVTVVSFIAGVAFLIAGAWPVFGFFGLDVVLIYWAFKANYRAAAAYEQVMVTPTELKVLKVNPRGKAREWSLNPVWVRLERDVHPEFGVQRVFLTSRGRNLTIGNFLTPDEKDSFSTALLAALNEAKRGPTRTLLA